VCVCVCVRLGMGWAGGGGERERERETRAMQSEGRMCMCSRENCFTHEARSTRTTQEYILTIHALGTARNTLTKHTKHTQ
jgi:hypothetical protein